jgi:hypothetical protein
MRDIITSAPRKPGASASPGPMSALEAAFERVALRVGRQAIERGLATLPPPRAAARPELLEEARLASERDQRHAAPPSRVALDNLLSKTWMGRAVLKTRHAAHPPARPPAVTALLEKTPLGRSLLAEERRRRPHG